MTYRRALFAIAACAAVLRLGLALRDLDTVDRMYIPDDTYYTLAIARSLAHGAGPTADGVTPTSGFQPLIAFAMVPVFAVTDDVDLPIRADLMFTALADLGALLLLAWLARRIAGDRAGLAAAALWAGSPIAIANALGGLETSLAICLELALVAAWCRARDRDRGERSGTRPDHPIDWALAGVLAGLTVLARIDGALLCAALGVLELRRPRRLAIAAATAAIVVAPWWIYSIVTFGSPVPESGAAVRDVIALHHALYLRPSMQVGWAAGTLAGAPVWDASVLRRFLFDHAALAWPALAVAIGAAAWASVRWLRGSPPHVAFAVHGFGIVAFYTFGVPALWFFRRYFAPAEALLALLVAIGIARLGGRLASSGLAALVALELGFVAPRLVRTPEQTIDRWLDGAKGYRAAARDVLALVPPGSVVAAFQSGALAYYRPAGVQIVNLDGVVDHRAAAAGRAHHLAAYARARGATHLADWPFNLDAFRRLSQPGELPAAHLLGRAGAQGDDAFRVLALRWPQ